MKNYDFPKVELKYVLEYKPKYQITSSEDVFNFAESLYDKDSISHREYFYVILLNRSNHILGYFQVSEGGISGTVVDVKLILQAAILSNSTSLIMTHNHPSGNKQPSPQDIKITQKVKEASKIMDIHVLDHIIVTPFKEYYSFLDEGIL